MTTAVAKAGPGTWTVAEGTAVTRLRRLKLLAGGTVEHAGAADKSIGVADNDMPASGESRGRTVTAQPLSGENQLRFTAAGPIAVGAEIQAAADGKVASGAGLGYICITPGIAADGNILTAAPLK